MHVLRFKREALNALIDGINACGYALTGGAHSRIDSTIDQVYSRLAAGNLYVNRNIIGAVVGVQPFGGHGLSGTGPKAGGPLYLKRLLARAPRFGPSFRPARRSTPRMIWPKRSPGRDAAGSRNSSTRRRGLRDWASRPN